MDLVLLREIPEDANLRRQWNTLAAGMEEPQVFYTYEWALAVYRAYRTTLRPLLFLAYDGPESLTGVAALAATAGSVSFLCATTGDYCDFLSPVEQRQAFVASVMNELKRQNIREVALSNLPSDSATAEAIHKQGGRCGYHFFARTAYVCAQISLSALERRGTDKPILPRKKMLRRFLNAMGRENPVRLDHARSWEETQRVLPQLMLAHVARFLVTGRISNMARAQRRTFLTELAKLLSEPGWVAVTRMMSGDKVFAWNYGFQFAGTWFWYQPTFDSDLEKYSPGFCLLAKVVEEAAENPSFKVVDLGLGTEEYKERFANQSRETLFVTLQVSASRHCREIARYHAARVVRASPKLERSVRLMIHALQKAKTHLREHGVTGGVTTVSRRLGSLLWATTEVFFYEWSSPIFLGTVATRLRPMDLNHLAVAAVEYVDDEETLAYLLRAARRLRSENAEGYVLTDVAGRPLHFAWLTAFDRFYLSELKGEVDAPSADAVMLFDSWTPVALRGRGFYGQAIEQIAGRAESVRKRPWIFSAASNASSVRGLAKAGFQRRYSLFRKTALGWTRIVGQPPVATDCSTREAPTRA